MTPSLLSLLCAALLGLPAEAGPEASRVEQLGAAIEGATDWLLANQRPDGAWGSHHSARVIDSQLAASASDHLPLVADLELVSLRSDAAALDRKQAAST